MTKRQFQADQAARPIGTEGIEQARRIAREGYAKINCVAVDSYSASALVAVYDRLNEENRAKLAALTVPRAVSVCFKLINAQGA